MPARPEASYYALVWRCLNIIALVSFKSWVLSTEDKMRLKLTQSRSGLILSAVEATEEKAKIFSKI